MPATVKWSIDNRQRKTATFAHAVLCEKWIVQNRYDIEHFSSVFLECSSANLWFWALSCLPESQL